MDPSFLTRQPWRLPLLLFSFALAVRLVYLFQLQDNPLFDEFPQAVDHFNFDQAATNFSRGDWLARSVNNSFSPLYKYFLGVLYWLSDKNFYFVYGVQFCLGALGSVLVYSISRHAFGFRAGLIAFLGFSLFSTQIIYEGILLRASFISFLGLLSLFLLQRYKEKPNVKMLVLSTVALSLFFQARPNTMLCLPVVLYFLHRCVWKNNPEVGRTRSAPIFWSVLIGSMFPLLLQCYFVHGKFVFFDASGPHTFISGNLSGYSGVGFDPDVVEGFRRENVLGYASNIQYLLGHITGDLLGFIKLYIRKLFFLLNDYEPPTNISIYLYKEFSGFVSQLWGHFALFSAFGLVGWVRAIRRREDIFLLHGYFISLSLAVLIFLNESRYRIPIVPYFVIFSAYALDGILRDWNRNLRRQAVAGVVVGLVLFGSFTEINGLRRIRPDDFNNMAYAWNEKNDIEKSNFYIDRALKFYPNDPNIQLNKGLYYYSKEDWRQAAVWLEKSYRGNPTLLETKKRLIKTLFKLSRVKMDEKQFTEAIPLLKRVLKLDPESTGTRLNLGVSLAQIKEDSQARIHFLRVLEQEPENSTAQFNLNLLDPKPDS